MDRVIVRAARNRRRVVTRVATNERDGAIRLVRRPPKGLLGGMAALPGSEWTSGKEAARGQLLASVRHVFTHFALDLDIVSVKEPGAEGWWQPIAAIEDAGLPTLYRRAVDAVLSERNRLAA